MKYAAQEEVQITQSWLGTLPNGWVTKRLKYISTINDETLPETTDPDYEMLYVDIGSVDATEGIQKKEPMIFETAPSRARRVVQDGDTIVSTVRTYLRAVAPIRNSEQNLIVSTGFAVIRPKGIDPHYLAYSLRSSYFIETVVSRSVGVSYPATNPTDVSCIELPLPPVEEQQTIARFLDAKTAQIDALVAQKQQLIAKLKEKRSALIARTVTRGLPPEAAKAAGLEPNPEMKDSGVDWLGAIPRHWRTTRLKYATNRIIDCPHDTPLYDPAGSYLVVRTADLDSGTLDLSRAYRVDESEYLRRIRRAKIVQNDILYGREGERWGYAALAPKETTICLGQRMMQFQASVRFDSGFLMWHLNARSVYEQGTLDVAGSTAPHVNVETIRNYLLAEPPLGEQTAIAAFIGLQTMQLDRLVAQINEAITRLTEYRQALITSTVTGKIDVRGLA